MGDPGVGKSSLVTALRDHVPSSLREVPPRPLSPAANSQQLPALDGPSTSPVGVRSGAGSIIRRHAVIVWAAHLPETMRTYATRWKAAAGASPDSMLIVCNMTDVSPCPLPEMNAMRGSKIPALAVSAMRGTNVGALWLLIERSIVVTAQLPAPRAVNNRGAPSAPAPSPPRQLVTDDAQTSEPQHASGATTQGPNLPRSHGSTPSPASVIPSGAFDPLSGMAHVSSVSLVANDSTGDASEHLLPDHLLAPGASLNGGVKERFEHSYEPCSKHGSDETPTAATAA